MSATEDVRLLLRFFREAQPGPRAQSLGAVQGVGPSHDVDCPDCEGLGWRRVRRFGPGVRRLDAGLLIADCPRCEARGWLSVDDYTEQEVGTTTTGLVLRTERVSCDGCGGKGAHGNGRRCRYCEGTGSVAIPSEIRAERPRSDRGDALSVALRAAKGSGSAGLWAAGSFAALDRAMGELQPWAKFRLWAAYVTEEREAEPDLLAIVAARVRHIERGKIRVPTELRQWARNEEQRDTVIGRMSKGERNAAMRRARAEGMSLSAIARKFGVAKSTAGRVCG